MTVELWGLDATFYLGLPLRPIGYLFLFIEASLLLAVVGAAQRRPGASMLGPGWRWLFLGFLLLAALVASGALVIQFPAAAPPPPGLPSDAEGPRVPLLGDLPWLLAGGVLGVPFAGVVGAFSGLMRAGWDVQRLMTAATVALQAVFVAALLRQNYSGWLAARAREPFFASLAGGLIGAGFLSLEAFAYSGGDLYDGLNFALARFIPLLLASLSSAAVSGALAEVFRRGFADYWYKPVTMRSAPYNRSLAARLVSTFLLVLFAASALALVGGWILARASARDLVQGQMTSTAAQAAELIPFFIQSGRASIRSIGEDVLPAVQAGSLDASELDAQLRSGLMFRQLAVYDSNGALVTASPSPEGVTDPLSLELEAGLSAVMEGIPQELALSPAPGGGTQIVFLFPLLSPGAAEPLGAVAGWVNLQATPALASFIRLVEVEGLGEILLLDERGRILVHKDPAVELQNFPVSPTVGAAFYPDTAPDGSQRLVYVLPIAGYSWQIVVTAPQREVDRLALSIALRQFAALAAIGILVLGATYLISRRLTRPLTSMAEVAESIARGNLDLAVPIEDEDEIGRLATSFERMRRGLRSRLTEMDMLLTASQSLASSFDLPRVLPPILEGVRSQTGASHVRLVLVPVDPAVGAREIYSAGKDPGNWAALDAQIFELCRERGRITLENPSRARAVLDLERLQAMLESLIALPIQHEGKYVGTVWIGHAVPRVPPPDELNLLTILVGQLGVSIANVRLYHRAEQERRRLGAVLEATPDAVLVVDRAGRISLANRASETVLRQSPEESIGQPLHLSLRVPALVQLLLSPGPEGGTAEVTLEDGRVLFAAVREIEAAERGWFDRICVLRDITHYKRLDKLKSEFVSTVSHDLRAPLTLTKGYGTMLSMVGSLTDQQKEFVRKILDSIEQMSELVDNLLDLGRIEAGVALHIEELEIEEVVREVIATYRPQAVNKQIVLDVMMAEGMERIEADATLLRQAIANLVDNGIKYTRSGGRVIVHARQQDGRQIIQVEDNGVGVAPADQARLFEKFYRARRRETLSTRGSGLGLSIVKSIAEQHGGSVSLESRLGQGSTFTLEIPIHSDLDAIERP